MVKMIRFIHYLTFSFLFISLFASAQDSFVSLEVSPLEVEVGEPITILIKTDAGGAIQFDVPDEFIRAGGTQSGMSSSIDYTTKTAIQFSYQKFMGYFEEKGKYKIGPVKIQSKNGVLKSLSYEIKVQEPINLISADPAKNLNEAIFGIIEQSDLEVYEGQPLLLSSKVYSQVNLVDDQKIYTPFEFDGPAEVYPLQNNGPNRINTEKINGREVITFSVGKTLLFPEKSGQFDVKPFGLSLLYEDPEKLSLQRAQIKSNKAHVTIKPLPSGTPSSFIGAVGSFNIKTTSRETKLKEGEVFEFVITISGKGNLHNIEEPKLNLPKGLVVYGDPIVRDSIVFSADGATGSVQFTYNIQTLKANKYNIEPVEISYFDTEKEKYKTVKSSRTKINVSGDKGVDVKQVPKTKPKKQNNKLKTILVENTGVREKTNDFYNSSLFWATTSAPIALGLLFGLFIKYREENKEQIEENVKKKSAKKTASVRLDEANIALKNNNSEVFHGEIEKSIKTLLAHKLGKTETEITRNTIAQLEVENKIDSEASTQLKAILDQCDQARYGFETSKEIKAETLAQTKAILNQLDKQLKK